MSTTLSAPAAAETELVLRPGTGWQIMNLPEIWRYRDLLWTLAGRDVKLRYRQTALGAVWIILQPLLSAGVFSLIFGKIANLPSDGVPYFLFIFAGQLGWNYYSNVLGRVQGSLLGNQNLVSKIYFPRMILPLSSVIGALIDFAVALALMGILLVASHFGFHLHMLLMPVFLLLLMALALGIGLAAAALIVTYRDVGQFVGQITSLMMYASPILYSPTTKIHGIWKSLYFLNPMASLIMGFRWSLLGKTPLPPMTYLAYSVVVCIVVFVAGCVAFNRMERKFADVI